MATIYQHKESKFWYARYTDPTTGKRVSKSTKTESKKQARIIAGKYEGEARDAALRADSAAILRRAVEVAALEAQAGTLTLARAEDLIRTMAAAANPTATEASFRRLAGAWLDQREADGIRPQTWTNYSQAVKATLSALGDKADLPLRQITPADCEAIQGALRASRLSGASINGSLKVIRRIFESAVASGTIDRNPAAGLRPMPTSDSAKRLPFGVDEVQRLLAAAPSDEWHGLILLAASSGLRCGDLRALTSANIQDGWIVIVPAKTGRSSGAVVKVPLTSAGMAWIAGREGPLFPSMATLRKQTVADQFDKVMEAAGVPKTAAIAPGVFGTRSFHSLRHSFITWLAESGVASDARMALAGHTTSKIHAKYSHHEASLQEAVAKLPDLS